MTPFARNTPVLETDALAGRSVLCVGLGSGGSTQMAREGFFADSPFCQNGVDKRQSTLSW